MTEPTVEEYMTITQKDYDSMINEKCRIELNGRFLLEFHDNAFGGTNEEDTVEHIEDFLKIVDSLSVPNVTHDRIRRRGDDEEVITDKELSNPRNEFNYLSQIIVDVLTNDSPGFKSDDGEDGYCNTEDLPGLIREDNSIRYEDYEWYATLEDS
ncbi:hypothetical protein Tco_0576743 [Tanacetum coccineum]